MGTPVERLIKIGIDSRGAREGATQVVTAIGTVGAAASLASGALAGLAAALGLGSIAIKGLSILREFDETVIDLMNSTNRSRESADALAKSLTELSARIPSSTKNMSELAQVAYQLGNRSNRDIERFVESALKIQKTTDLNSAGGVKELGRFLQLTPGGASIQAIEELGGALNALGDEFGATGSEILGTSRILLALGNQFGVTQDQAIAAGAALASFGADGGMAGVAIAKLIGAMGTAIKEGGDMQELFAQLTGQTAADFKKAFEQDAFGSLQKFLAGMKTIISDSPATAQDILSSLGLDERKGLKTLLPLINNYQKLGDAYKIVADKQSLIVDLNGETENSVSSLNQEIEKLWNLITSAYESASPILEYLKDGVVFLKELTAAVLGVPTAVSPAQKAIKDLATDIADYVVVATDVISRRVASTLSLIWDLLKLGAQTIWQPIKFLFDTTIFGLKTIYDNTKWFWDAVFGTAKSYINSLISLWVGLFNVTVNYLDMMGKRWMAAASAIQNFDFTSPASSSEKVWTSLIGDPVKDIKDTFKILGDAASTDYVGGFIQGVKNLPDTFKQLMLMDPRWKDADFLGLLGGESAIDEIQKRVNDRRSNRPGDFVGPPDRGLFGDQSGSPGLPVDADKIKKLVSGMTELGKATMDFYKSIQALKDETKLYDTLGHDTDKLTVARERAAAVLKVTEEAEKLFGRETDASRKAIELYMEAFDGLAKARERASGAAVMHQMKKDLEDEAGAIGKSSFERRNWSSIVEFQAGANKKFGEGTKEAADATEDFKRQLLGLEKAKNLQQVFDAVGESAASMFEDAVFESENLEDSIENIIKSLSRMAFQTAITKPLGAFFGDIISGIISPAAANGAKSTGQTQTHAEGGDIFGRHWLIPANGNGPAHIVGEEGPERISKLGSDRGRGNTYVTMNVTTPNADSFGRSSRQVTSKLRGMV